MSYNAASVDMAINTNRFLLLANATTAVMCPVVVAADPVAEAGLQARINSSDIADIIEVLAHTAAYDERKLSAMMAAVCSPHDVPSDLFITDGVGYLPLGIMIEMERARHE